MTTLQRDGMWSGSSVSLESSQVVYALVRHAFLAPSVLHGAGSRHREEKNFSTSTLGKLQELLLMRRRKAS
ncbi:unnamed protein product [Acanthoscelides obtectus]|uniref:Uncharacterized protein n=1 Tax=Acanthoscelides obtectus TaxID=200917 RepID=A0A9P0LJ23_ACAOB|nr:unnamed protein product [Acanthoscelides obtectus]CAK1669814.1 hypothetical protein AOBTE_LOCUS27261 [Acanthoscelides obtectus]